MIEALTRPIFNAHPRAEARLKAEASIWKALKLIQKEDGLSLYEACEFLLRVTTKFRVHREYLIKIGESAPKFTPHATTWYNQGRYRDENKWQMPPEEKAPTNFYALWEKHWPAIEKEYGIQWQDPRFWRETPAQTWEALPAAVRAELKSLTN